MKKMTLDPDTLQDELLKSASAGVDISAAVEEIKEQPQAPEMNSILELNDK